MTDKRKGKKIKYSTITHARTDTHPKITNTPVHHHTDTAMEKTMHRIQKKSDDTFVFPHISHSFRTNFMKLSANIRK